MSKNTKTILWIMTSIVIGIIVLFIVPRTWFSLSNFQSKPAGGIDSTAHPVDSTIYAVDSAKKSDNARMKMDTARMKADTGFSHDTSHIHKAHHYKARPGRNPASVPDSGNNTQDTISISKKFGTLGYHYDPIMNVHETQEINVYLRANSTINAIRDSITKILKDEDPNRDPADTGKIEYKEQVPIYKYLSIKLESLDSGIVIRKTPDATRQLFDLQNGNKWSWVIYSNSAEKEESKLLMTISSEDPAHLETRYIRIKIRVERNVFRTFYNYLIEHPGDFIFKIIVPLITFIGGILFGKRKDKNKKAKEPDKPDSD